MAKIYVRRKSCNPRLQKVHELQGLISEKRGVQDMVDTYGRIGLLRAHECTERLVKSQNSNSQSFACLEKRNNDLENEEPPQDA